MKILENKVSFDNIFASLLNSKSDNVTVLSGGNNEVSPVTKLVSKRNPDNNANGPSSSGIKIENNIFLINTGNCQIYDDSTDSKKSHDETTITESSRESGSIANYEFLQPKPQKNKEAANLNLVNYFKRFTDERPKL